MTRKVSFTYNTYLDTLDRIAGRLNEACELRGLPWDRRPRFDYLEGAGPATCWCCQKVAPETYGLYLSGGAVSHICRDHSACTDRTQIQAFQKAVQT